MWGWFCFSKVLGPLGGLFVGFGVVWFVVLFGWLVSVQNYKTLATDYSTHFKNFLPFPHPGLFRFCLLLACGFFCLTFYYKTTILYRTDHFSGKSSSLHRKHSHFVIQWINDTTVFNHEVCAYIFYIKIQCDALCKVE